ncbi:uncharacterized protein LOC130697037 [Daphnia carinata]|uniref:uncharacterized protein LOC130697037 n=1 Tax=Daphnia carinata TaxID=120202 RepID=UPI002868F46B|nr:uncharacterized protein LOC130697037 [Daphnia carinata]
MRPEGAPTTWKLTEIDFDAQTLALELINLVTDARNPFAFEAGTLLRHPFFIRYCQFALPRLIKEQVNGEIVTRLKMKENITVWKKSLGDGQSSHENFSDFERILFIENKDIETLLTEASTRTPQLLSQYIWHLSTSAFPNGNDVTGKVLGKGSFGKVYEYYYSNKDGVRILAAFKKCKPLSEGQSWKEEAQHVFEREIIALSQLNHLFIINYLGVAEMTNEKYIVMELCEGSLKDYFNGNLEQVPKDSLDNKIIISQVALGLAYMHSKGIIHKDLKLDNILLKRQSPTSPLVLAKITDFGLAKEFNPESSRFSDTIHPGTPSYMAPELLCASHGAYPVNFASDVYSFGITVARIALKGDHPFTRSQQLISMREGLVPPKLHDLSWDLIDLIVNLIDKDPTKRPSMALVLCHPYFILTNDKTKRHFVEQLWPDLSLDNRKDQMKKIFNRHNFQEWYRTITADKPETAKEKEDMEKTLQLFKNSQGDCTAESLYPVKKYKQKIKNALTAEYDAKVGHQIEEISSNHYLFDYYQSKSRTSSRHEPKSVHKEVNPENEDNSGKQTNQKTSKQYLQHHLSRNRLHKLIQNKPGLLVSYIWFCLAEIANNSPANSSTATTSQQKPTAPGVKKHQLAQFRHWITNELQWCSFFYDDEKIADELWKMKYPETSETTQESKKEIIRTAAKCNISLAVWTEVLKWMGKNASALLREVVQSHVPNAPKVAEMILEKHWFKEEQFSSLHLAAFNEGNYTDQIMRALLDSKKIPTATEDGLSPVHIAAQNESNCGGRLLKLLLDKGADPNACFQDGTTPVHWAALNQGKYAAEILKFLLDCGGNSDKIDEYGLKPIHYATLNTSDSAFTLLDVLLKKRGANAIDSTGRTLLLHFAVLNERDCVHGKGILKKLLENRENPNIGDNEGCTPLHLATRDETFQRTESIRLILQYRSNPNAADQLGRTPVHYAAANEGEHAYEYLKLLLAFKGNLNIRDKDGLTPTHYTIINKGKCGDEMRKLVGVNPQKTNAHLNNNGESLLHHVIAKNDVQLEIVQLAIQNGGDPNAIDKSGRSSVHSAISLNESLVGLDILKLLLANGGNVNLQDKEKKFTPVHLAASSLGGRLPEKMKILLKSGGDVNTQGNDGITPLHLAVANSGIYAPQLTRILLKFGADVNAIDVNQRTPLHEAIRNENDDISFDAIQQLIEKGANPNARDSKGLTPAHYAVKYRRGNSDKVMKLLLQHGGSMKIKDNKGMTPQHLAEYFLPTA